MPRRFPKLRHPIVQAPLAGGPSTPALAAAVSEAGGLGFLAAGYLSATDARNQLGRVRELTDAPVGVNIFCLAESTADAAQLEEYARSLTEEAARYDVELGEPRFEDDDFAAKLELVVEERVPIVSFTFGCPLPETVARLHDAEVSVWVTVTEVEEAQDAEAAGADALVVQGVEAGGHRATFADDDGSGEVGLLALLRLVSERTDLPLIGAGGIADGPAVAAVLAAGARAAQLGTAFMRCPEAATSAPHLLALTGAQRTALTRAFTGRRARGIVNRFMREHEQDVPRAYPQVHHLTAPLRRCAREAGDPESINLWAGQAYPLAEAVPAGELIRRWADEARAALSDALTYLDS